MPLSSYMKRCFLRFLGVTLIGVFTLQANAQETGKERMLFVGNSFTFFWNTPQLVEAMAENQGVDLETFQSTVGGSNLKQHWEGEKNTQTRRRMEEESWNIVVLQDHSNSTIAHTQRFHEYGKKFIGLVREKNATPVLFMTWAYESNPLMQEQITREYNALAKDAGVKVIPAGPVWEQARAVRPDLDLFFDDKHPTPDGTYLNALLIFKTITGRSVADIPDRLFRITEDGEKEYLCFVLPENGKFLRDLVERMDVANYNYTN